MINNPIHFALVLLVFIGGSALGSLCLLYGDPNKASALFLLIIVFFLFVGLVRS